MENKLDYKIYATVEKQEVKWLWYPYIPYGKLTLLQGDPGDGKSTFMINIAASLTTGGFLPDGKRLEQVGNVIYQGAEDNIGDTIKPRLEEAGADCDRVAFIDDADMGLTFTDDRLEKAIQSFQAKLLVLDPLQAFMPSNADMQNASHVRSIMRKLGKVAEQNGCAIVMIGHMTKSTGGKRLYRGLGSIDIAAICRSVLMISRDEQNPEIRYMYQVKSNLAPESNAVGFVMSSDKGFQWIGKCNIDKKAEVVACSRKVTKKEKASEYLRIMLSVEDVPSVEIIRRMDMIGIKERTVRTVQKEMGVQAYRKQGTWYWHMSEQEEEVDEE